MGLGLVCTASNQEFFGWGWLCPCGGLGQKILGKPFRKVRQNPLPQKSPSAVSFCSGCADPQSLAWPGHTWSPGQTCLSSSPFAENFSLFANIAVSGKILFCWSILPADWATTAKLGWSSTLTCCLCITGDKKKTFRKDVGMRLVAKTHSVRGKIWNMSPPEMDKKPL